MPKVVDPAMSELSAVPILLEPSFDQKTLLQGRQPYAKLLGPLERQDNLNLDTVQLRFTEDYMANLRQALAECRHEGAKVPSDQSQASAAEFVRGLASLCFEYGDAKYMPGLGVSIDSNSDIAIVFDFALLPGRIVINFSQLGELRRAKVFAPESSAGHFERYVRVLLVSPEIH